MSAWNLGMGPDLEIGFLSTAEHKEHCLMLCGSLDGRRMWGRMDTCVCTAESLCCSPKTIATLLTGYTPIQNKKLKNKYTLKKKANRNRVFADVSWGSRWGQTGLQWALNSMPDVFVRRGKDAETWWRWKQTLEFCCHSQGQQKPPEAGRANVLQEPLEGAWACQGTLISDF